MAVDLVNLVGNARYDVLRYPVHVALVTDLGHRTSMKRLIQDHAFSGWAIGVRYMCAILVTFAIPFGVLDFKSPPTCQMMGVIYRSFRDKRLVKQAGADHEMCDKDIRELALVALVAVILGPLVNIVIIIVMRISLCCTRRLYSKYVWLVLQVFNKVAKYMYPVLYFFVTKPDNHELSSFFDVWKRLTFLPYTIMGWFLGILAVIVAWAGAHFTFGGVLALFLWQVYLPIIVQIFKGSPVIRELAAVELGRRELAKHSAADDSHRGRGLLTDVWWRLLQSSDSVFTCSSAELELMVQYFETSHAGFGGQRWPIWWHDELCITGNNGLEAVYLDDLNYLLKCESFEPKKTQEDGMTRTLSTGEHHSIAEEFLESLSARVEKLYDERRPMQLHV